MSRKAAEAKDGDRLKVQYKAEDDNFYNRDMVKKQRGMVFSEVSKIIKHKLKMSKPILLSIRLY